MELNHESLVADSQGYDYEYATTVNGIRIRIRIRAYKSYPQQSFAVGEVWMEAHGWVECATLIRGNWVTWGKPSPRQDADCKESVIDAKEELLSRIGATLGL